MNRRIAALASALVLFACAEEDKDGPAPPAGSAGSISVGGGSSATQTTANDDDGPGDDTGDDGASDADSLDSGGTTLVGSASMPTASDSVTDTLSGTTGSGTTGGTVGETGDIDTLEDAGTIITITDTDDATAGG